MLEPDLNVIQELQIQRKDHIEYIYFQWLAGRWFDLSPYGNRMVTEADVLCDLLDRARNR